MGRGSSQGRSTGARTAQSIPHRRRRDHRRARRSRPIRPRVPRESVARRAAASLGSGCPGQDPGDPYPDGRDTRTVALAAQAGRCARPADSGRSPAQACAGDPRRRLSRARPRFDAVGVGPVPAGAIGGVAGGKDGREASGGLQGRHGHAAETLSAKRLRQCTAQRSPPQHGRSADAQRAMAEGAAAGHAGQTAGRRRSMPTCTGSRRRCRCGRRCWTRRSMRAS